MNLYTKNKKYQKALFFTNKYFALKDSMYSLGSREEVIRQNLAFQYKEKIQKDSIISIQKEKNILLEKKKEAEIQKQKNREQKIIFISLIIVLIFMSGIIFLVVRGYINKKRVSETTLLQNYKLEKIYKEITDSITYAKRIQSAILPSEKLIKTYFPDSFILYKPKDIVAGDFYWFEVINDLVFFAVADCTGHGVPGAMVSVICHNALNRGVKEFNLKKAGEILDKTREIVIAEFEKSEEDVKDGMDISLCVFNIVTKSLIWSGANNPLWIIRKNVDESNEQLNELNGSLVEFKGDKQPIGKYAHSKLFTTLEINLYKGDEVYMFTDGFQDQFGGEKGKKFKALKMREMLLSIKQISMNEKKNVIDDSLEKWKGNLEQVDDVCIIGVRI
jgi:serine phosphatase RsbU (regulator of sigma subunit)